MQFNIVLVFATFLAAIEACKCGGNIDATKACCRNVGGNPSDVDCPANQISERLSNFASCCNSLGSRSDCRCPVGCARNETDAAQSAAGLPLLTDAEVTSFVASYGHLDE
ncbi:uncharacterized protein PAC_01674 [Phialocephala subalpina]|uniref:Extracellular membrane protein CFEM domain-containing protein n=1 Tax=Phialocephala subalpina TaxID=576137 RepID=A0A1L7WGC0_9HELO|nr:uncharacterized protein PAC_01674 [Phialocephala subalpina]